METQKQRERTIQKKYNIGQVEYELIKENQNQVCKICGRDTASSRKNISFMIDHCHEKGHVRGLLCYHCNIGLGHFKDNIQWLKNAIDYLQQDNEKYFIYEKIPLISVSVSRPITDSFDEQNYVYTQNVKVKKNERGIVTSS